MASTLAGHGSIPSRVCSSTQMPMKCASHAQHAQLKEIASVTSAMRYVAAQRMPYDGYGQTLLKPGCLPPSHPSIQSMPRAGMANRHNMQATIGKQAMVRRQAAVAVCSLRQTHGVVRLIFFSKNHNRNTTCPMK